MKQYFSLKSVFLGTVLLVSGTLGLIGNASAHDSHRYDRHYYQHKYSDKHRHGYKSKRSDRYYNHDRRRYHHRKRHEVGRYYSDDHRRYHHGYDYGYDKGFSRPHRKKKKQCFNFRVKAIGGKGGFRFQHNIKDFKRLDRHGYSGKICGRRHVEFELSKVTPGVKVVMKINGKRFVYGAHSGHDRYINHWHRKYYSVRLGRSKHDYYD